MQFRRMKSLVMTPLLVGAAAMIAGTVFADAVKENPMLEIQQLQSAARKAGLRTNADPTDPDTVWVGHISGTYAVPWSANPNWTGWGPFHVGRGGYRGSTFPASADTLGNNSYWGFDHFDSGGTDTLQGLKSRPHPYSNHSRFNGYDRTIPRILC